MSLLGRINSAEMEYDRDILRIHHSEARADNN